jgi:hypothetical protein
MSSTQIAVITPVGGWGGWRSIAANRAAAYGRMAMARIMANVRHIVGCRRVRLLVAPANVHATRLYAQAGFQQVGVHPTGELILQVVLPCFGAIEDIIALLRASSVLKRARRAGRLRLSPGPHAAPVIGVERGPPSVPPPHTSWRTRPRDLAARRTISLSTTTNSPMPSSSRSCSRG